MWKERWEGVGTAERGEAGPTLGSWRKRPFSTLHSRALPAACESWVFWVMKGEKGWRREGRGRGGCGRNHRPGRAEIFPPLQSSF